MLALLCCLRCGSVDWGGEGAEGASATGSEELPPRCVGRSARGARGAYPLLTSFGWGRLRPLGGDRRHGAARLWRAAEMRLKTWGSDAGGPAAGGGGGGGGRQGRGGRRALRRGRRHCRAGRNSGARRHRPGVVPPGRWWGGGERVSVPPSRTCCPLIYRAPPGQPGG